MDKLITLWQNMTTEQLVITLLIVSVVLLFRMYLHLAGKYGILNTNHLALWIVVAPAAVKWHHTGEYHIDIKSLVDLTEKMNKEGKG